MFRILFVLFLLVPLIEIYFLIKVGHIIGAGWTIFSVLATAVIGTGLLRVQGLSTLLRAQTNIQQGNLPAMEMMEGIILAMSGMLLLTPGFVTDTIGFLLLIPYIRQSLIKRVINQSKFTVYRQSSYSQHGATDSTIIEGEIVDNDENDRLR